MIYNKISLLLASIALCTTSAFALSEEIAIKTIDPKIQDQTEFLNPQYLLLTPNSDSDAKVPLIIFLHGGGGKGDDIERIKNRPMNLWEGIQKFDKGPCIVVMPQCLKKSKTGESGTWAAKDLNIFLEYLQATLPVDSTRIYLTGHSMGASGTWRWAANNPEHFAAAAPISGSFGGDDAQTIIDTMEQSVKNLASIPVYAFAGKKDVVVSSDRSVNMVAAIQQVGGKQVKLKVYPDEGHGAKNAVFRTVEYYDWLFSKKRND